MKSLRLAVLCSLLFLMRPDARACWCLPQAAKEASQRVDVVFRGQLVEHRGSFAVFKVSEQWKGNPGEDFEVEWREGNHGDCNGSGPNI
jgi:hypothetical protein